MGFLRERDQNIKRFEYTINYTINETGVKQGGNLEIKARCRYYEHVGFRKSFLTPELVAYVKGERKIHGIKEDNERSEHR